MARKIPQRMCVGCGEMFNKKELLRVVKNKEGEIFYDPIGKANGRGAYICKNPSCFDLVIKDKKLEKVGYLYYGNMPSVCVWHIFA